MAKKTHGMSRTPEYKAWEDLIKRCVNPKVKMFPRYGGRGITVCDEWKKSFLTFYRDVGPRPSPQHSLDRKNSNGNYEPSNIRWATRLEQQQNLTTNVIITHEGQSLCLREWARRVGVHRATINSRCTNGVKPPELFAPSRRHPKEFRGVSQNKYSLKWCARKTINYKTINIGCDFESAEEAAMAVRNFVTTNTKGG